MAAITIRNLPDTVHDGLRRLAAERHVPVEALVRAILADHVRAARTGGIDFDLLAADRAMHGLTEDGPEWTGALDDPGLTRLVLGINPI